MGDEKWTRNFSPFSLVGRAAAGLIPVPVAVPPTGVGSPAPSHASGVVPAAHPATATAAYPPWPNSTRAPRPREVMLKVLPRALALTAAGLLEVFDRALRPPHCLKKNGTFAAVH